MLSPSQPPLTVCPPVSLLTRRACDSVIGFGSRAWYGEIIVTPPNLHDVRFGTIEIHNMLLPSAGGNLEVVGVARLIREGQVDVSTSNPTRPLTINGYLVLVYARCGCQRYFKNCRTIVSNYTITYGATVDGCRLVGLHPRACCAVWGVPRCLTATTSEIDGGILC